MKRLALLLAVMFPIAAWGQAPQSAPQQPQKDPQQPPAARPLFEPLPRDPYVDEMHFSLLQRNGPRGSANILFVWGGINAGDAQRFRQALDAAKPAELWLASPGGNLDEAIEIAHMVRSYKLTTRVPQGGKCISACNAIFMGGIVRYVDTDAAFVVHMFEAYGLVKKMRRNLANPPADILTFTQRYPEHPAITAARFKEMAALLLKAAADKNKQVLAALPDSFKDAVLEHVKAHGKLVCPLTESPPQAEQKPEQPPQPGQPATRNVGLADMLNQTAPSLPQNPGSAPAAPKRPERAPPGTPEKQPAAVDIPDDPCLEGALRRYLEVEAASEEVKFLQQNSAQEAAVIARFLTEMSVSLRFLTEFANIPNDKPRALTRDELRSLNVVNTD